MTSYLLRKHQCPAASVQCILKQEEALFLLYQHHAVGIKKNFYAAKNHLLLEYKIHVCMYVCMYVCMKVLYQRDHSWVEESSRLLQRQRQDTVHRPTLLIQRQYRSWRQESHDIHVTSKQRSHDLNANLKVKLPLKQSGNSHFNIKLEFEGQTFNAHTCMTFM